MGKGGGGGGAIIYCMRKYLREQLAAALRGAGLKADYYHAGRPQEERQRVYARFMEGSPGGGGDGGVRHGD